MDLLEDVLAELLHRVDLSLLVFPLILLLPYMEKILDMYIRG